jgi:hypothetical protein
MLAANLYLWVPKAQNTRTDLFARLIAVFAVSKCIQNGTKICVDNELR